MAIVRKTKWNDRYPIYLTPDAADFEKAILRRLKAKPAHIEWKHFPSGECHVNIGTTTPATPTVLGRLDGTAERLWHTALLCDTLTRNGAKGVQLALPYFAYARQDRIVRPGDPVTGLMLANLLSAVHVKQILTVELHSQRIADESPVMIRSVSPLSQMAKSLAPQLDPHDQITVLSPDLGGLARAKEFAACLDRPTSFAWIEKRRSSNGCVTGKRIEGQLEGHTVVIVDDMLDTGGTVDLAAGLLRQQGFRQLYLAVVHPIFSGPAIGRIARRRFRKIVVGNAYPAPARLLKYGNVEVFDCTPQLSQAIKAIC